MMDKIIHTINPRAKRLSLRIDIKSAAIRLTIPKGASQHAINRFLNTQKQWIIDRQKQLKPKQDIVTGTIIPFMGIDHHIHIESHTKRSTEITRSSDDPTITIKTSRDDPTQNLKRWIIHQAQETITALAHTKAKSIDKSITQIDFRDTSSRWGSCSSDARLMFSWRVIMAPPYVLDYLVAHEVAHLKHMNHSKEFWDLCYQLGQAPDKGRIWLKQYGNNLMQWF